MNEITEYKNEFGIVQENQRCIELDSFVKEL